MKDGQLDTWKRLPRVLALARDKPALSTYLRDEIDKLLETRGTAPESAEPAEGPAIPVPDDDADAPPDDNTVSSKSFSRCRFARPRRPGFSACWP
jgi:hypothetical protein